MRIIISPAKNEHGNGQPALEGAAEVSGQDGAAGGAFAANGLRRLEKALEMQWPDRPAECPALQTMELRNRLTPAILAYEGIQYQYMAHGVFTDREFSYVQEHLRILSGFYGILKPFDGVTPYRLEMQTKLRAGECRDLYAYWDDSLARELLKETDCIVNLASKEYSRIPALTEKNGCCELLLTNGGGDRG